MKKYHRVCVTAHIRNGDKVLIALRSGDDDFLPGHWEQVGGSLDAGEDPVAGLKREVKEETGLSIEVVKPYYVYHYMDEAEDSVVEIAFVCEIVGSNEVSLSPEHEEYKWITAAEVNSVQPMTDMVREATTRGFSIN